jgi:membrane protein EpsK
MTYSNKYQTKINLLFNVITFAINALIGLVLPAFLIDKLGVGTYSLIPISMSITSFMLIITVAINGTLSRFLSIDFATDFKSVNTTFSTSYFVLLGLFLIFMPLLFLFVYNPSLFLNISENNINDSRILFGTIIIAFVLNSFASLFNSIAYVKNRINLQNISLIINRLGIIVFLTALFLIGYINVQAYGIAVLFSTIISFIYSYKIAKKLHPDLEIRFSLFDIFKFKLLSKLGFWLMVNQVGVLLFLQTDILVVNNLLGEEKSGIFGTLIQWSFLIRTIIGIFSTVFGPLTLTLYANQQIDKLIEFTKLTTKLLGILSSVIAVIIVYFAKDILRVWLGVEFEEYTFILQVMIFHLGFNLAYSSIVNINIAYNKAEIPGIVTLLTGVLNICLGIVLIKYTSLGILAVAISGFISLTIKNFVFTPLYAAKIMGIQWYTYIRTIFSSLIITLFGVGLTVCFSSERFQINSFIELIMGCIVLTLVLGAGAWFLLRKEEKIQVKEVILSKIGNQ